jgi:HEAT repeat protein
MFQRRPNIARLARRGDVRRLVAVLSYRDLMSTSDGGAVDLGAGLRADAASALGAFRDPSATRALLRAARADPDAGVRRAAVEALEGNHDPEVLSALVELVCTARQTNGDPALAAAISCLHHLPREAAPAIARTVIDRGRSSHLDERERWAMQELFSGDDQKAQECSAALVQWLGPTETVKAQRAGDALVQLAPWGRSELIDALADQSLAPKAAEILAHRRDGDALEPLIHLLRAEEPASRRAAAMALGELRDPLAAQSLFASVSDPDREVRVAAADAVDKLGLVGVVASVSSLLAPLVSERQLMTQADQGVAPPHRRLGPGWREGFREIQRLRRGRGLPRSSGAPRPLEQAERHREEETAIDRGADGMHSGNDRAAAAWMPRVEAPPHENETARAAEDRAAGAADKDHTASPVEDRAAWTEDHAAGAAEDHAAETAEDHAAEAAEDHAAEPKTRESGVPEGTAAAEWVAAEPSAEDQKAAPESAEAASRWEPHSPDTPPQFAGTLWEPVALQATQQTAQPEAAWKPATPYAAEEPEPQAAGAVSPPRRLGFRAVGSRLVGLAAVAIAVAAVLGFVLGHSSGGHHSSTTATSGSYGNSLDTVIQKLNLARTSAMADIRKARSADATAAAEGSLAQAHNQAALALQQLHPGSASSANAALATALRRIADAYGAVALAVRRGDPGAERRANAALGAANQALQSALGQLQRLGYRLA